MLWRSAILGADGIFFVLEPLQQQQIEGSVMIVAVCLSMTEQITERIKISARTATCAEVS